MLRHWSMCLRSIYVCPANESWPDQESHPDPCWDVHAEEDVDGQAFQASPESCSDVDGAGAVGEVLDVEAAALFFL